MTSRSPSKRGTAEVLVATLYLFGLGLWASGLLIAGAIVAPVVFRVVPAPTSGDAMAIVFQRIDRLALILAVVLAACEGTLAVLRKELLRKDLFRCALLALMVAGALTEALYYTPQSPPSMRPAWSETPPPEVCAWKNCITAQAE